MATSSSTGSPSTRECVFGDPYESTLWFRDITYRVTCGRLTSRGLDAEHPCICKMCQFKCKETMRYGTVRIEGVEEILKRLRSGGETQIDSVLKNLWNYQLCAPCRNHIGKQDMCYYVTYTKKALKVVLPGQEDMVSSRIYKMDLAASEEALLEALLGRAFCTSLRLRKEMCQGSQCKLNSWKVFLQSVDVYDAAHELSQCIRGGVKDIDRQLLWLRFQLVCQNCRMYTEDDAAIVAQWQRELETDKKPGPSDNTVVKSTGQQSTQANGPGSGDEDQQQVDILGANLTDDQVLDLLRERIERSTDTEFLDRCSKMAKQLRKWRRAESSQVRSSSKLPKGGGSGDDAT